MYALQFVWNDETAAENLARHGVSFDFAIAAFLDPRVVEWAEEGEDEEEEDRLILLGLAGDVAVVIAYAELGDRKRIFSARRASKDERDVYFSHTAP
jgi:uncharacterized DUF497 family protein